MRTPTSPGGHDLHRRAQHQQQHAADQRARGEQAAPARAAEGFDEPEHDGGGAGAHEHVALATDELDAFHGGLLVGGESVVLVQARRLALGKCGEGVAREAAAVGREDLDDVVAGRDPVARPGAPATIGADRQVVARDLDAVARPDVLDELAALAGDRAVGVDGFTRSKRAVRALAVDDLPVDDAAAHADRVGARRRRERARAEDEFEAGHEKHRRLLVRGSEGRRPPLIAAGVPPAIALASRHSARGWRPIYLS